MDSSQQQPLLPDDFIQLCRLVTAKRPKAVIDHILQYGFVTTEELKQRYGYNHPPRAARDVREHGIPLETFRVTGSDGRRIAAYRFGDISKARFSRLSGRTGLSKQLKDELIDKYGCKCFIYLEKVDKRELQIDHRVPFEVDGEPELEAESFMLLCGSANRAKSWSCEHCENWKTIKDKSICLSCYWAYPESYTHVAMQQVRRIDLMWQGDNIESYEKLKQQTVRLNKEIPEFIKDIIEREIRQNNDS
ncbi:HNH endonuclease [Nostoc sp. UCD121]|uniref:HNH endonuclease n=1 Tax=Nostoc sp. UCD120 TaxID=2681312 RepID=UPI001627DEF9|nr:HNH endonuclease [Nostoc sp. UCD120]MBC1224123.1 HNH endonuclease [Nostoc sp. UCD120]MBC1276417.1 HNH endonuclease [Nostoc sp. UCD121]MBC1295105.1 HNH endonuclease [Nostoc sp. UCD122]